VKPEIDRGCIGFVLFIVLVISWSDEALGFEAWAVKK
jgi:hypothetical protein